MFTRSLSLCNAVVYVGLIAVCTINSGCLENSAQERPEDVRSVSFSDATADAGLAAFRHETGARGRKWMPETFGAGGAFIDYDGDGWLDVLLVRGGVWEGDGEPIPALELYRNERNGSFVRVTDQAGLGKVSGYGFGVAAADYDNDGDEDIFLTTLGENMLFRNDDGVFAEVGRAAGLATEAAWSTAVIFFDADRDGWLDLYVGNYVPWTPATDKWCTSDGQTKDYCTPHQYEGTPGRFFRNNRDGTFAERTHDTGLGDSPGKTLGVATLDFNTDGWPDFVVANDTQRNLLYRNNGDGTFREIGVESGVAYDEKGRARAGMGIDAAVLDGSGQTTIAIGNFSEEMVGFYRHVGNGLFRDVAPASGIGPSTFVPLTFGLFFFDADLDSDLDLFMANGHIVEHIQRMQPSLSYRQPAQLFLMDEDGTFALAEHHGGVLAKELVGRGAAYGDYDRDGDLDILMTENGGPAHLWRNELNPTERGSTHYLRVELEGTSSSRDALGARLVAVFGGRRQERSVRTGSSYLSQSEKTVTLGLGAADVVDTLRVYWPSGREDVFEQVKANQTLHLVEGQGGSAPGGAGPPSTATAGPAESHARAATLQSAVTF